MCSTRSSALTGGRVPDPILAMAGKGMRGNASMSHKWNANYPARVGVMPRTGDAGDVRWFDVEPCFVFHPLNAYDNGDSYSVMDVVRMPTASRRSPRSTCPTACPMDSTATGHPPRPDRTCWAVGGSVSPVASVAIR